MSDEKETEVASVAVPTNIGISPGNHHVVMGAKRIQNLHAVRIHACPHCQAPGVWKSGTPINVEHFGMKWPSLLVDPMDERVDQPVGDICPQCAESRTEVPDEDLGIIWSKETVGVS